MQLFLLRRAPSLDPSLSTLTADHHSPHTGDLAHNISQYRSGLLSFAAVASPPRLERRKFLKRDLRNGNVIQASTLQLQEIDNHSKLLLGIRPHRDFQSTPALPKSSAA
ncbi:hypothetical protein VE01_06877 [Pseudogymnoascus verrucosus]|uniref:Uncharacterized protein n=1 Tax=Pseudogymnoascus verrucosus TaxID=342668 RepID=A0A1B8GJT1_9PEZI|nr:uncharacterized protein VE01_06877 [Pseudogymnoascus verrucosus]OBT96102.1 hypothetical protein VE01_06877 [Pseudogymnoascus verrucosus]